MDQVIFSRYSGETAKIIFAPLFIGLARDYFRDLDISISIVEPKEQPWITVAEGRADCGPGYIDYCASPEFHGRMKAVAVHEQFRPGHGITTLLARTTLVEHGELTDYQSLRGKTIGLAGGRGDDCMAFYGALQQGGLTIRDVRVMPASHGGTDRKRAILNGEVDLLIGRRPRGVATEVSQGHVVRWKVGHEVHPNLQARFILFNTKFMRERPGVGSRFLTAYLRGARDYCDAFDNGLGTAEMIDFLTRETGESDELLQTMKPVGFTPNGLVDMHRLESEVEILVRDGLFPQGIKIADVVDNQFAENALKDLGEYH
jgi:NitT/TauT family transport system substrate-binding protein